MDWALWFYWIMATTLGWLVGALLFNGIPLVVSGVAIAAFQWSVLYKRIQKSWRWLVFSALGWIGGTIFLLLTVPEQMGLLDDVWVDPPQVADGYITAPERPGHGLAFKEAVLKDFLLK